ncbi:hypothetical protein DV738_g3442, partial [Chaetothyriales sp. CBS 135597]
MAPAAISALGMALNHKTASVDIPRPRDAVVASRDNFTAVPAKSRRHGDVLPTPPSSISPNLPPHGHGRSARQMHANHPTSGPDSDIDLADVPEEAPASALNAEALDRLGDLDSAGAITPGLLAKHHLPDILLAHGPLAIRHIMGYLTTSVPGFSRITSAKARRLVVAALEGRGIGAEGGGINGDVLFEKVGWGRWDARVRGQPPRDRSSHGALTPPASLPSSYANHGLQLPAQASLHSGSERLGTSLTANSAAFSHSEADYDDQDMLEMEADKMSLDGNDPGYASSEPADPIDLDLDQGSETDEEDWRSIGAEALRARSLGKSPQMPFAGGRLYQPIASYSVAPPRPFKAASYLAQSAPARQPSFQPQQQIGRSVQPDAGVNSSERAAIEALLSLGHKGSL